MLQFTPAMLKIQFRAISAVFVSFVLIVAGLMLPLSAHAQGFGPGGAVGVGPGGPAGVGGAPDESVFGQIEAPAGVDKYNLQTGSADGIGIIIFISNMIKLATIVAGVLVFLNFIFAGYTYITAAGDSGAVNKVGEQIKMSVIGLVLIVLAYTITAVISLIIFGDPGYILNPKITGP